MNYNYKINNIKSPLSVQFELTYNCNNRCIFCYNVNKHPENTTDRCQFDKMLSFDEVCRLLDKLYDAEIFELIFTGGEPTLHPDFLGILEYARHKGLNASFITNGNLMSPEYVKHVCDLGIRGVQVSLHGSNAEIHEGITRIRHSFEKTVKGIKNLAEAGIQVSINMTVCRNNISDIINTACLVKSLGACSFSITRFVASGEGLANNDTIGINSSDLDFIVDQIDRINNEIGIEMHILTPIPLCSVKRPEVIIGRMSRCDGGISWCGISPSGEVRFCTHGKESGGNLMDDTLENIWQKGVPFVRCHSMEHIPDACRECAVFQFCGGGCRAHALNCTGDHKGLDSCATITNIPEMNRQLPEIIKVIAANYTHKNNDYSRDISILLQKPYVDRNKILFRSEPGGILSFDGTGCNMFNEDALAIFNLCNKDLTVREIVEKLSKEFNQPVDELKPIIKEFLAESTDLNIVEWEPFDYREIQLNL